jgi:iron complex outermembrane recepter protein
MKKYFLVAMTIFVCCEIFAQTDSTKKLQEVVITATRGDQRTPVVQNSYSGKELDSISLGQEMPQFLGQTPGAIYYTDGGSIFGYSYWRLRGMDQTRINFTMDGVPMSDGEDQGFYSSNFPDLLNGLGSIQVQRGVGLSTNGVASYAGSVNMWSPKPMSDTTYGNLNLTYGSFNTQRQSVETFYDKKGFFVYSRFSRIFSDNYRKNSGIKGQTGFLVIGKDWQRDQLKLVAFTGGSSSQMAYLAAPEDSLKKDRRYNSLTKEEDDDFKQNFASLHWQHRFSDNFYLSNKAYYNSVVGRYDVYIFAPTLTTFGLNSNSYGDILNLAYRGKINVDLGAHFNYFNRTHVSGDRPNWQQYVYKNTGYKTDGSAYLKIQRTKYGITAYSDLQFRTVSFWYKKDSLSLKPLVYNFFNPKFGLSYAIKESKIFASYGINHREPTRNDLFAGYDDVQPYGNNSFIGLGIGDTLQFGMVKPETVQDIELGFEGKIKKLKLGINLYHMMFKNEIVPVGKLSYIGLPLRKNVDKSQRSGIEAQAEISFWKITLYADVAYQQSKIESYYSDVDSITYTNVTPLMSPNIISNQRISFNYKGFSVGLKGRYVSESYLDNIQNLKMPSMYVLSSMVKYSYKKHEIAIRVENLSNQDYYLGGYSLGTSRAFYVGASRSYFINYVLHF